MKTNINPGWVLTKTMRGVPIAIQKILPCVGSGGGIAGHEFLVLPRYDTGGTYSTTVKSEDVMRPLQFKDDEQAHEYSKIIFGDDNNNDEKETTDN